MPLQVRTLAGVLQISNEYLISVSCLRCASLGQGFIIKVETLVHIDHDSCDVINMSYK